MLMNVSPHLRYVIKRAFSSGRTCPLRYSYKMLDLSTKGCNISKDCVYFIGGLYGNPYALDALENLIEQDTLAHGFDRTRTLMVFNGDFNWFNGTSLDDFLYINMRLMELCGEGRAMCTAGNIESELTYTLNKILSGQELSEVQDGDSVGCGCAYPPYVGDATVANSNQIMNEMIQMLRNGTSVAGTSSDKANTTTLSDLRSVKNVLEWMESLPMLARVDVGSLRIGVLHGDMNSLAGWKLAVESMKPIDSQLHRVLGISSQADSLRDTEKEVVDDEYVGVFHTPTSEITDAFQEARVDVLACTHTCLPYMQNFEWNTSCDESPCEVGVVVNNGSAGMPNFKDSGFSKCGLITRVAKKQLTGNSNDSSSSSDGSSTASASAMGSSGSGGNKQGIPMSLYGTLLKGVAVDAIPLHFDSDAWISAFEACHPPGSPAYQSYYSRICNGPDFQISQACRLSESIRSDVK